MKKVFFSLLFSGIMFFAGCVQEPTETILVNASPVLQLNSNENKHLEQLHDYDTPYTVCYKNKNQTYTMYIFSSPIQYSIDEGIYTMIDNTVVTAKKDSFAFENKSNIIKTYFPKTLLEPFRIENGTDFMEVQINWNVEGFSQAEKTIFTNMYGDMVSGVIYKRDDCVLVFYPTKAGIKLEIVLNKRPDSNIFSFLVNTNTSSYENKQNGYILLKEGGENKSIIYNPLVQYTLDGEQQLDVTTQIKADRKEGDTIVSLILEEDILDSKSTAFPIRLDPSFEMYLNKMPDSTVYKKNNINNYLATNAIIGEHPVYGEGWHYLRFRLNYYMTQPPKNLLSAKYRVKKLYANNDTAELLLRQPMDQWSSTRLTWLNRMEAQELDCAYSCTFTPQNWCEIDMTSFVQECLSDQSQLCESIGLILSLEQDTSEYIIFAASDNALYTPYMELTFSELPLEFKNIGTINDVIE